jgi:integrase
VTATSQTVNFTTARIDSFQCREDKTQDFQWDSSTPGLGQCVSKTSRAYVFQSRINGKPFRMTIGKTAVWRLSDARNEAKRLQVMVDNGQDPRRVKAEAVAADLAQTKAKTQLELKLTLLARTAWDAYMAAPHPNWGATHRNDHIIASSVGGTDCKIGNRQAKKGPLASLLAKPLNDITAAVVLEWLHTESLTRPTSALNAYRKFRTFINWCAEQEKYETIIHPACCKAAAVKTSLPKSKTKASDSLQREQLAPWFTAVKAITNPVLAAYFQALLITGARRNELTALRWADIDFKWSTMTINDKVEDTRKIPLTPYLSSLLEALPRHNDWVFSSPTSKSGHIESPTKAHVAAIAAAKLPHVSLHGLRRTFKRMADWEHPPIGVTAQIMGHKPSATAEKHYTDRSIDFLRMWHVKIEARILTEANITWNK